MNGGSSDSVPYFWGSFWNSFGSQAAQTAVNITDTALSAVNNFRNNPSCTGSIVSIGQSIGASAVGTYSAQAGFAAGGVLGIETGPGALATGAAGAALLGTAGAGVGYWAGGGIGSATAGVICSSGTGGAGGGGGGGGGLGGAARKKLGNLANRAGEKVRDVIRSRGGTASNVNQAGAWADRTLVEAAQAAANGDPAAETAVKIAKQAGRLGQKY